MENPLTEIVLCNLSDTEQTISDLRQDWTIETLINLGVPEEVLDFDDIDKFRMDMSNLGIDVILFTTGDVNIYKKTWHEDKHEERSGWLPNSERNLVAQWKRPKRIKKVEGRKAYYELHLNKWAAKGKR